MKDYYEPTTLKGYLLTIWAIIKLWSKNRAIGERMNSLVGYMRSTINPKQRNIQYYLEMLRLLSYDVEEIRVYSTAGDIRPPYPFQFQAVSKCREGDDDCYEGLGGTPLEAVKDLYLTIKRLESEK